MSHVPTTSTAPYVAQQTVGVYRLWVDGVGAFLVCLDGQVTIGGPVGDREATASVSLLSNLSRHHVRLIRSGEVWLLEPLAPVAIDSRPVVKHVVLSHGNRLQLGSSVSLQFQVPSPLSGTARLDFESSHRTQPAVDGVILFAETCVIGPEPDAHIRGPAGSGRVLLIRRSTGLWCKCDENIQVDGATSVREVPCEPGKVYAGSNWRFRLEVVSCPL